MGVGEYNKKQMERLHKHKIAFDQEAMWAAMQKKKKRRGAFIFFTMALVALAVVFLSYGLYTYIGPKHNNKNFQSENIIHKDEQLNNPQNKEELTINNSQNTTSNDINIDLNMTKKNTSSSVIEKNSTETEKSTNHAAKSLNTGPRQKYSHATKEVNTIKQVNNIENDQPSSSNLINDEKNHLNEINEQGTATAASTSSSELTSDIEKKSLIDIPFLRSMLTSVLGSLVTPKIELENLDLIASPIIDVNKSSKSRFHIGVYGGIGYLFRKISIEDREVLLNDETLEEVSAGIELKYQLRPHIFIRSGIEYWHGTDRKESSSFTISNLNEIEDLTEFGLTEMDQGTIVQYSYFKKHAIYQSINIPLLVGYSTNNNNWNVFAEAGIMYNLLNTSRGELPFEVNETYQIGSRNQVSPIAGFGLSYSPSSKIELYTRLNWRTNQSVTTKTSNTNQEYHSLRGQLGFRIGI